MLAKYPCIAASVVYVDGQNASEPGDGPTPLLQHIGGSSVEAAPAAKKGRTKTYTYPKTKTQWFSPGHDDFDYASDSVAHTRNLQFLKPKMNGPYFDLEDIWEEHTYYEFADRSVEHTMSTMVQEPYVNHVPTVSAPSISHPHASSDSLTRSWWIVDRRCWEEQADGVLPEQLHLQQLSGHRA